MAQSFNSEDTILTMAGTQMSGKKVISQIPGHLMAISTLHDDAAVTNAPIFWPTLGTTNFSNPTITTTVGRDSVCAAITITVPSQEEISAGCGIRFRSECIFKSEENSTRVFLGISTSRTPTDNPDLGWTQTHHYGSYGKINVVIDVYSGLEGLEPGSKVELYLMVASEEDASGIKVGQQYSDPLIDNSVDSGAPITITATYIGANQTTNNPQTPAES